MKVLELFEASKVAKAAKAAKLAKKFKLTYIKGYGKKSGDSREFTLADAYAIGFDKHGIETLTNLGQGETETFGGYQDKLEVKCLSEATSHQSPTRS